MGLAQKWLSGYTMQFYAMQSSFLISAWDINENAFLNMYVFGSVVNSERN